MASETKDTGTGTLAPFDVILETQIAADAITADDPTVIGKVPIAGTVTKVEFIPNATKAGANTNTRTLQLYNRQAGAAAVTVASFAMISGSDMTINKELDFTLDPTAANLILATNDIMEMDSTHLAAGLTMPGGKLRIHIRPALGQTP